MLDAANSSAMALGRGSGRSRAASSSERRQNRAMEDASSAGDVVRGGRVQGERRGFGRATRRGRSVGLHAAVPSDRVRGTRERGRGERRVELGGGGGHRGVVLVEVLVVVVVVQIFAGFHGHAAGLVEVGGVVVGVVGGRVGGVVVGVGGSLVREEVAEDGLVAGGLLARRAVVGARSVVPGGYGEAAKGRPRGGGGRRGDARRSRGGSRRHARQHDRSRGRLDAGATGARGRPGLGVSRNRPRIPETCWLVGAARFAHRPISIRDFVWDSQSGGARWARPAGNRCFVEYVGAASRGDHSRRAQRARRTLRCNPLRVLPAVLPGRRDRPTTSRVRAVPPISRARVRPEAAPFALRALLPCRAGRSRDLTSPAHALAPPRPDERRRSTHRHDAARSPRHDASDRRTGRAASDGRRASPPMGARPPGPPQMGAPPGMAPPPQMGAPPGMAPPPQMGAPPGAGAPRPPQMGGPRRLRWVARLAPPRWRLPPRRWAP